MNTACHFGLIHCPVHLANPLISTSPPDASDPNSDFYAYPSSTEPLLQPLEYVFDSLLYHNINFLWDINTDFFKKKDSLMEYKMEKNKKRQTLHVKRYIEKGQVREGSLVFWKALDSI